MANISATARIPAWRYLFNATFLNTQPAAALGINLGAYHGSEIPIVFGTFPQAGSTPQEIELSKFMRGAWATFAKNPQRGPGWTEWEGKNLGLVRIGEALFFRFRNVSRVVTLETLSPLILSSALETCLGINNSKTLHEEVIC